MDPFFVEGREQRAEIDAIVFPSQVKGFHTWIPIGQFRVLLAGCSENRSFPFDRRAKDSGIFRTLSMRIENDGTRAWSIIKSYIQHGIVAQQGSAAYQDAVVKGTQPMRDDP